MTILLIGIAVMFVAYCVLVYFLISRPKVFWYDVFAENGKWLDTIAAFSRKEVERFYHDQNVYVRRHEK
jgi:hypothetical protein